MSTLQGTQVSVASNAPEGLVGAINFAGGYGGDPVNRKGSSCDPGAWVRSFKVKRSNPKVPTLWIYWKGDWYWGNQIPKMWFDAFMDGGGIGEFVQNDSIKGDGHLGFSRDFHTWMPIVRKFFESIPIASKLSFTDLPTIPAPVTNVSAENIDLVPLRSAKGIEAYKTFLDKNSPKAFAISENGRFGWSLGRWDVTTRALKLCNGAKAERCELYAVDEKVVWKPFNR